MQEPNTPFPITAVYRKLGCVDREVGGALFI
jgi:hypothetical protein